MPKNLKNGTKYILKECYESKETKQNKFIYFLE
jgi:hypothetical protein